MKITGPVTISVDPNGCGAWNVASPDVARRITCETLEDARTVANLNAAHGGRRELVADDAYHRVIRREILHDGSSSAVTRKGD
ncbi:MAG TPA: hypothetical protein VFI54_23315 [Solirubrobacteraceae bacterium]|nr:hypothetical protein [Solirubrobacteraceae bacterium]